MNVAAPLVQIGLLGEAVDGAPVAILVTDEGGRYVAANRYACELLGYTREELLQLRITDVAPAPDVEAHYRSFIAAREDQGTVELRRKDGTVFAFRYRASHTAIAGIAHYVAVGVPAD